MWLLRSILCAGLLVLCSVCADTKQANVVYYDPPLKLAYADNIHPYAYAHQTPLPTYAPGTNAYSGFNAFDAFVESADSLEVRPLRADSPVAHNLIPAQMDLVPAAKYVEAEVASADSFLSVADELHAEVKTKAEVQAAATERSGRRRRVGIVMDTVKKLGGAVKDTLFGGNSKGDPKNPADPNPMPLKPNPSPFQPDPPYHGTFPGNDAYRRAVYGLRRRRMPYTTSTSFGSINPYRRPNDYHHNSRDMLFPRDRFAMAMNPMLTDLGRMGGSGFKRYGDYSSFTPNHMLPGQSDFRFRGRAMVGDLGDFGTIDPSRGMDAYFGHPPTPAMFGLGGGSPMAFNGYKFSKKRGMMFGNPLADGPSPFIPGMDQFFDFYKGGGGGAPAAGAPPAAGAAPPADGAAAPPAQQAGF